MRNRSIAFAALLAASATLAACTTLPPPPPPPPGEAVFVPPHIAAAVIDPARPEADRARDGDRRPSELIAFTGLQPGMKVADLIPGGGYYTRILSRAVGPRGRVYAYVPDELTKMAKRAPAVTAVVNDPAYKNTRMTVNMLPDFGAAEKLDLVWTSQNYHDMHARFMGPVDVAAVNRAVFRALKPGGVYLVTDHSAEPGSGLRDVDTLHRIDPMVVRQEVEAAGFILEGESRVLRNPRDDRKASVFDEKIRGRTDQFVYKFRKPRGSR